MKIELVDFDDKTVEILEVAPRIALNSILVEVNKRLYMFKSGPSFGKVKFKEVKQPTFIK